MKVGDLVKIDPNCMSILSAKRYNNNPMGIVIWVTKKRGLPEPWGKVKLTDGREYSYPASVLEIIRTESVLDNVKK